MSREEKEIRVSLPSLFGTFHREKDNSYQAHNRKYPKCKDALKPVRITNRKVYKSNNDSDAANNE